MAGTNLTTHELAREVAETAGVTLDPYVNLSTRELLEKTINEGRLSEAVGAIDAAEAATSRAKDATAAAVVSKNSADKAAGDATAAATKAEQAAEAAASAVAADTKVWMDYDDEGYLCIYEARS